MILQSSIVIRLIDEYKKKVPEVPLRFEEHKYGIIVYVPKNFDTFPEVTRVIAKAKMEEMFQAFQKLGIPFNVKAEIV